MKYNRNQYVPVVVKSREYLIGALDVFNILEDMISYDENILDSVRLSDWLPNGQRRKDLEPAQIKEIMKRHQESLEVKENESDEDKPEPFFKVSCVCGNYHEFRHPEQLPHENLKCEICGKVMIDYCGHYEYEYEYNGDEEKMGVELGHGEESDGENEEE
jgi:hypothetical protein